MNTLTYKENDFYMDGKPFRIISGAIHYFRVVPEYWEDRLLKLKACGFNTVETYVCWNLHERKEGVFDFAGILDLPRFIETATALGLYVMIRPGPYICAEWEFGGLPSWLLSYPGLKLRCDNPLFIEKTERYLAALFQKVSPYLSSQGGNIIAMQIENEYGSYGNDHAYLEKLKNIYLSNHMECMLFTSDGPSYTMLKGGSIDGCYSMVNFGSRPEENFDISRKFHPNQPVMCGEFWNGWFDHWYEEHHTRDCRDVAETLDRILQHNGSVNFYMFHGGTNFGFLNGANYSDFYEPTVTSYDYDSPVNECGDLTPKFFAVKEVLEKYFGKTGPIEVSNLPKKSYGRIELTQQADLFENLDLISKPRHDASPLSMEALGQDFGFVLYSTTLKGPLHEADLQIDGLHDRAIIFIDGVMKGIKERTGRRDDRITIQLGFGQELELDIFVENMGRVNYGKHIYDKKGIIDGVRMGYQHVFGWTMRSIHCENLQNLQFASTNKKADTPTFLRGIFQVGDKADTFVRLDGFTKGIVLINGFNLGRYWNSAGPQKTLYLPAPLLKQGENEIIVFELERSEANYIVLTDQMDLGT